MGKSSYPNEVREEIIRAMGDSRGSLFYELWNELSWTHAKWEEYTSLFASGDESIRWMNAVAPRCFHQIQTAMWRDIVLQICRLTDPPRSAGKENISIDALGEQLDVPELGDRYEAALAVARQRCKFARERRNRIYAHRDLLTARSQHPEPLADVSQKHIDDALDSISAALNVVQQFYEDSTTYYAASRYSGDAEKLLRAVAAEAIRKEERMHEIGRISDGIDDHA